MLFPICLAVSVPCAARISSGTDGGEDAAAADQRPSAPQSTIVAAPQDEIIVTGKRWGQADIASETEVDADEIGAYGADDIGELLKDLAPLIDGTGGTPAILVNGRRIGSPSEITGYPPEALNRVAILPPEAAARYGYPAGQRVVNLELKQKYASWSADGGLTVPTAGGRRSAQMSAGRTAIDGNMRWNAEVTVSDDSALLKSARRIPVRDDILALLPTLQDDAAADIDPNRFESLSGKLRSVGLNAGVTRPLGSFSASLGINAALNRSKQWTGIPIGSIILPPGSSWVAVGGQAVTTSRLLGDTPLQSGQRSESFGVSATLSGLVAGWQTSLSAFYSHNRNANIYDRGYDISAVQARVDAGDPDFDPFGPWPATPLLSDRTRFRSDMLGATFNASNSILKLPAGDVGTSLTVNANRTRSRFTAAGATQPEPSGSDQLDGRLSFTIPVTSRAAGVLAPLGDIALDFTAEIGTAIRTPMRRKWNAGVRWVPFSFLDLRASIERENAEPNFDQLYGPRVEVVTRLFDFAQQEYVQPISIFGGNPDLRGGSIDNLSANAMIRPFAGDLATLNIGYRRRIAQGGIASLPTLTPDVEAAFPERITRDATGRLIAIDARSINISHDRTEAITSGLTLRYTARPKAAPGAPPGPDGARPWTFSLSVIHNWQLASEMVIRPGLPVLDRLRDSGQARHNVALNFVVGRRGMGASLNGNWNGAARVRSTGETGGGTEFRYAPSILFNLGLFAEPEHWAGVPGERNWASDLRISLDIQNILNGYRKVSVLGGGTPRGFSRDEIDPLGRTVRLSIRKQF